MPVRVGIGQREAGMSRGGSVSFDRGTWEATARVGRGCSLGLPFPLLCGESQV
jgi:hypothetical protein